METNNKTKPLDTSNPVVVLNDGEKFSSLVGTMIAFPSSKMDTDEIEELLKDDMLDTFTFGNDPGINWSLEDISKILKLLMPNQNIEYNKFMSKITIQ